MTTITKIRQTAARRERARAQRSIPREPSPRNLEIYRRVTINCEPQHTLAAEYHLHPTRISQILRAVRAYTLARRASEGKAASITNNAGPSPIDSASCTPQCELLTPHAPHTPTPDSPPPTPSSPSSFSARLATLIAHQEDLLATYKREYRLCCGRSPTEPPPPTARSPLGGGDNPTIESASPPSPLALQYLKAISRTLLELRRLYTLQDNYLKSKIPNPKSQIDPTADATNPKPTQDPAKEFRKLQNTLFMLRQEAEDQGLVPKSPDVYWIVENLLNSFLGRTRTDSVGYRPLTEPYRQFLQAFLTSPSKFSTHSPETAELVTTYLQKAEASPTASFNPQPAAQGPAECVQRSADTLTNDGATSPPTPNSQFPTPSPNSSFSIQPSEIPSSLNMSAPSPADALAPTPNPTTTSIPEPSQKPAPKKSPPPPPKTSSFPLRGPVISLIDPADYKALFDPWSREY